jgi:hypothetical protein
MLAWRNRSLLLDAIYPGKLDLTVGSIDLIEQLTFVQNQHEFDVGLKNASFGLLSN